MPPSPALPFADRLRDHGTDRPPEIAAVADGPFGVEPHRFMRGIDHGLRGYEQRFQGGNRQAPVPPLVRCEGFAIRLGKRLRNAIGHGGWPGQPRLRHVQPPARWSAAGELCGINRLRYMR